MIAEAGLEGARLGEDLFDGLVPAVDDSVGQQHPTMVSTQPPHADSLKQVIGNLLIGPDEVGLDAFDDLAVLGELGKVVELYRASSPVALGRWQNRNGVGEAVLL